MLTLLTAPGLTGCARPWETDKAMRLVLRRLDELQHGEFQQEARKCGHIQSATKAKAASSGRKVHASFSNPQRNLTASEQFRAQV